MVVSRSYFLIFSLVFLGRGCVGQMPEHFGIDLYKSLCVSWKSDPKTAAAFLSRQKWKIVKSLYDKFVVNNPEYLIPARIPKIIHQIWLGSPLPEKYLVLQETWKKNHPDWEYKLWTDKDIDEFGLINRAFYDETSNWGAKSDIARYEILYRIGGLYVDTDFECLRPFDVFNHCCDFYAGAAYCSEVIIYNGLIGAAPGHPILKACIDGMRGIGKDSETCDEIQVRTGPFFLTRRFFEAIRNHDGPSVIFPPNYFYPWPNFERANNARQQVLSWVRPETFAIHHWHVSWAK